MLLVCLYSLMGELSPCAAGCWLHTVLPLCLGTSGHLPMGLDPLVQPLALCY